MKPKSVALLTALVLCGHLSTLTGCLKSPAPDSPALEPHAVGNIWRYDYQGAQNLGKVSITGRRTFALEDGTTVDAYAVAYGSENIRYVSNGSRGLYAILRQADTNSYRRTLLLKHPAEIGDTWTFNSSPDQSWGETGVATFTFVARNQNLTTRAGTFRCLVYRLKTKLTNTSPDARDVYIHKFYAPGIGLVGESVASLDSTFPVPDALNMITLGDYVLN